jgi:hypothetical protein
VIFITARSIIADITTPDTGMPPAVVTVPEIVTNFACLTGVGVLLSLLLLQPAASKSINIRKYNQN